MTCYDCLWLQERSRPRCAEASCLHAYVLSQIEARKKGASRLCSQAKGAALGEQPIPIVGLPLAI